MYRGNYVHHVSGWWRKNWNCEEVHNSHIYRSCSRSQCVGDYIYGWSHTNYYSILIDFMTYKIFLLHLWFLSLTSLAATGLQSDLNGTVQELIPVVQSNNQVNYVNIAREVQFWLFVFVGIIAVACMIYIGAKLLWAQGNMEELYSATKSMVYIIIGLALIPLAYFIVQLIVNIRLW